MNEIDLYDYDFLLPNEQDRNPYDHHIISHAEVEVFGIDPDLIGQLEDAKWRYEYMIDLVCCPDNLALTAKRDGLKYSQFIPNPAEKDGVAIYDDRLCMAFMSLVCDLPYQQCFLYMRRYEVLLCRLGIQYFPDRPEWPGKK